jgi:hypothetical protein
LVHPKPKFTGQDIKDLDSDQVFDVLASELEEFTHATLDQISGYGLDLNYLYTKKKPDS